jgi:phenylacetate-CoA ligase
MMKYQGIYDRSPIFFQNFMATMYGYKAKKNRYGKAYRDHLEYLKEVHQYSREQLEELQFNELMNLLRHAVSNSKFYRELYDGIDIESFSSVDDLKRLPIVTKEMIRQNIDDVITIPKMGASVSNTGGTTGKSLTVYNRKVDSQKRMAVLDFFKMKHGFYNLKMKRATFMGKHIVPPNQKKKIFWRYNHATKQMVYSSFHLSEENIPHYVASLNRFKPDAIDGYPSSMNDIANYIIRYNLKLEFIPVAIFPTAETVTADYRENIEKAFGAKIRDQYASSEGAPFVWECTHGKYHYDITTGVIEHFNDSNEVLVTSFLNYGTPLIRYQIGDDMVFLDSRQTCACGFNSPLIESIEGRTADFLYSTDGAKTNHVGTVFTTTSREIVKAQLIQNSLNHILVKVVVDGEFTDKHRKNATDQIRRRLGTDMCVTFEVVDDIPRERSGKYKLIVNNVMLE